MNIYIKETAKRYGVTLTELADRLRVTRQTVHYYIEQGDKNPMGQLEKIANAIGCPIEELYHSDHFTPSNGAEIVCPRCGGSITLKAE